MPCFRDIKPAVVVAHLVLRKFFPIFSSPTCARSHMGVFRESGRPDDNYFVRTATTARQRIPEAAAAPRLHVDGGVTQALDHPRFVPRELGTEAKQPCARPLLQPAKGEVELAQRRLIEGGGDTVMCDRQATSEVMKKKKNWGVLPFRVRSQRTGSDCCCCCCCCWFFLFFKFKVVP